MTQQTTIDSPESRVTVTDLVDRLMAFEGSTDQFLTRLLAVQCHVGDVEAGGVLRQGQENVEVLAFYPPTGEKKPPEWLRQAYPAVQEVATSGRSRNVAVRGEMDLYGQEGADHVLLVPLAGESGVWAVGVYLSRARDPRHHQQSLERLELTRGLLTAHQLRRALESRARDLDRQQQAMEVLAELNTQHRFQAAAMAACNEIAARWDASRVGIGFLEGRYVKLKALSHTEKIIRKMRLVQDMEAAMEECLDQDVEVIHPAPEEVACVSRAHAEHAAQHGPAAVLSLPLRREGEPLAVLTVERAPDRPLETEEIETLRLTSELCTARLMDLYETDRWFGSRWVRQCRAGLAKVLGPEHTWIKLSVIGVLALVAFVTFGRGVDRVEAPFSVEAVRQQVVPAPFDGFLDEALVEPGDRVIAGKTPLARMDISELRMQLASERAERVRYLKEADLARRERNTAEAQIARAEAEQIAARIALLEHRIDRATIHAPISGVVLTGDLKKRVGSPLERGEELFQIAPLEAMRAELIVPEDRIVDVEEGDTGELASESNPGDYVPFEVTRITPLAEVRNQVNGFRVRAKFSESRPWMLPGQRGQAKIEVGTASYFWIWTRGLVNWIRMKLWI